MNNLEKALSDATNVALDFYLEDTSTDDFRLDLNILIGKSKCCTPAGELKEKILLLLEDA